MFVVVNTCLLVQSFFVQSKSSHLETVLFHSEEGNALLPWPTRITGRKLGGCCPVNTKDYMNTKHRTSTKVIMTRSTVRARRTVQRRRFLWTRNIVGTRGLYEHEIRYEHEAPYEHKIRYDHEGSYEHGGPTKKKFGLNTKHRTTTQDPTNTKDRICICAASSKSLPLFHCQVWQTTLTFTEKSLLTAWKGHIICAIMVFVSDFKVLSTSWYINENR